MIKIKEFVTRQLEYEKSKYSFAKKLGITPQRLEHYLNKDIQDIEPTLAKKIWNEYMHLHCSSYCNSIKFHMFLMSYIHPN